MDATEICPLTKEAIEKLLKRRRAKRSRAGRNERRQYPRWPFPAPLELWRANEDGVEEYVLATCENLSSGGVGILCDQALPLGEEVAIAIHQPEMSFHGRAAVRHLCETPRGYYVGLEFVFETE